LHRTVLDLAAQEVVQPTAILDIGWSGAGRWSQPCHLSWHREDASHRLHAETRWFPEPARRLAGLERRLAAGPGTRQVADDSASREP